MVSTLTTPELSALCNSQSAFNPLHKVSFLLKMTDWRWEFQQKKKQLGIGVLQKLCILNSTTFIYASFHTVSSISYSACSMLLEIKADNNPVGGPVKPLKLGFLKFEKETDVKGNISHIFINDDFLDLLLCFL